MKKTINVNLGSMPFVLDEDAFMVLSRYLDDVKLRIDEQMRDEVLDDIENRVADILSGEIRNTHQVVTISMVRRAVDTIGAPDTFGERKVGGDYRMGGDAFRADFRNEPKRFYRSRDNSVLAGVCGGLGTYLNIDPTMVRIIMLIFLIFGGAGLWIYIIIWIVVPKEPFIIGQNNSFTNNRL